MPWSHEQLHHSLTNHPPASEEVIADFESIRFYAKEFGDAILAVCPDSRERSVAITKLEETVMWAIKSIAVNQ